MTEASDAKIVVNGTEKLLLLMSVEIDLKRSKLRCRQLHSQLQNLSADEFISLSTPQFGAEERC